MKYRKLSHERFLVIALKKGDDLTESIQAICEKEKIHGGSVISGIGALAHCRLGYFDLEKREYQTVSINEPVELVSTSGTITFTNGTLFPHIHLIVSNSKGECAGGHALSECIVSVTAELVIVEFDKTLLRSLDPESELLLLDLS
ncbi:MAG: PPC domain-containing DNA-binding protein [Candidatus Heimdallarchaeota archaeon]